jgi:hypothetical protein
MKLNKPIKIGVGLATAWMFVYPFLFFAVWLTMAFGMFFTTSSRETPSPQSVPFFIIPFLVIFPLHCLTIVLMLALIAFYLIHVIKNNTAAEAVRIILGVGIFFMPFIAMPIYFYLYIWRDTPPDWAIARAT